MRCDRNAGRRSWEVVEQHLNSSLYQDLKAMLDKPLQSKIHLNILYFAFASLSRQCKERSRLLDETVDTCCCPSYDVAE